MIKEILTLENDADNILTTPTSEVSKEDLEGLNALLSDMKDTMHAENALGLAANQIGENKAVLVLRDGPVMINPNVVASFGKITSHEEGCLSVPNERFDIKRKRTIIVEYLDESGNKNRWKSKTKMQAVAAQHEIDHLKGVTVKDRS